MKNIFAKKNIRQKRSFGSFFKNARKRKNISLSKAEIDTKIRMKYLVAIENDDFSQMAPEVYNIGYIEKYCEYLGLKTKDHIQKYKQEKEVYDNLSKNKFSIIRRKNDFLKPGHPEKFQDKLKFVITPQIFTSLLIVLVVIGILGFMWFQVKSFAAAPPLDVNNPQEQIVVSSDSIEVSGKTDPTANLYINNQNVSINEEGFFEQTVVLQKGLNEIEIKAENKANRETVKSIKVLVVSEDS